MTKIICRLKNCMGMLLHLESELPTYPVLSCPAPLSEELLATAFHSCSARSLPKCRAHAISDSTTTGVTIFSHRIEILYEDTGKALVTLTTTTDWR